MIVMPSLEMIAALLALIAIVRQDGAARTYLEALRLLDSAAIYGSIGVSAMALGWTEVFLLLGSTMRLGFMIYAMDLVDRLGDDEDSW